MKSSVYSAFGKRLKRVMLEKEISSKELAEKAGCAQSTICDVLKGRNVSRERRQQLINILELENEN